MGPISFSTMNLKFFASCSAWGDVLPQDYRGMDNVSPEVRREGPIAAASERRDGLPGRFLYFPADSQPVAAHLNTSSMRPINPIITISSTRAESPARYHPCLLYFSSISQQTGADRQEWASHTRPGILDYKGTFFPSLNFISLIVNYAHFIPEERVWLLNLA